MMTTMRHATGEHTKITSLLHYDERPTGGRGPCLQQGVTELGLQPGDRLDPSNALSNVAHFESIQAFRTKLTFWRPSQDSVARRGNPLFSRNIGVVPEKGPTVDALRTLFSRPMRVFCRHLVWA